ncbi:thiosulfate oxidation carrier complex protein SoxZ [Afifella pfennigii]|uniref:thiosulfate oxidation carrier complex protein SoxZ n=1 Tax=Afifella pfennigii TaxID=209897 RepID=UPI00047A60A3|nr:thiosulfate oxidation carrier complex protein SoxZ [Afifella pfennigii]
MATPKPRVKVPKTASPGEVVTIKTLISHEMESGQRRDQDGNTIPRRIINSFTCTFDGVPVFSCDIEPAISANPYFEFAAKVEKSGTFAFEWVDDDGSVYSTEAAIEVK